MQAGDHLVSPRPGFTHHGLYVGNNEVIHYAGYSSGEESGAVSAPSGCGFVGSRVALPGSASSLIAPAWQVPTPSGHLQRSPSAASGYRPNMPIHSVALRGANTKLCLRVSPIGAEGSAEYM